MDRLAGAFQIKTVDFGQRVISGWAAYHANTDRVADIIDAGASVKAVARLKAPSDVGVFIGHDLSRLPVGVPIKIEARSEGLYTETKIFEGPTGDDLLGAARGLRAQGQSLGMSIGYRVHDSRPDRVNGKSIRRLTDYSLHEYSFAASQAIANPAALVVGVKSQGGGGGMPSDKEAAESGGQVYPNTLPDSAFLHVAPGGVLDDEGKTVPRSLRYFRFRGADGALDGPALAVALTEIPQAKAGGLDAADQARLATRVRRMSEQLGRGEAVTAEPAEWKTGATLDVLTVAYRLIDATARIATEHKAMAVIGEPTRAGWRLRPDVQAELKAASDELARIVGHAALVAEGRDEEALADWWRAQFSLLEAVTS